MASTREERLQMRQRGAGTRKIQQVDFGISFGGQGIGPESASIPLIPEPAEASQFTSAPTAATPSKVGPHAGAPEEPRSQRAPGSARNQLPQRPSTFDIPPDNGPGEPPSNKKRKLNPSSEKFESPSRRSPRGSLNRSPTVTQNGGTAAEAPRRESSSAAPGPPILLHAEPLGDNRTEEIPETEPEARTTTPESRPSALDTRETALETTQTSTEVPRETQLAEQREPTESSPKKARKSRSPPQPDKAAKVAQDRSAKRASPSALSPRSSRGKISKTADTRKRGASKDASDSGQGSTSPSTDSPEVEENPVESTGQKERAQRPSRTTRKSSSVEGVIPNVGSEVAKAKGPRARASIGKPADAIETRQASPTEPTKQTADKAPEPNTRKGRQATKKADAGPDPDVEGRQRDSSSESAQVSSKAPAQSKRSARKAKKKAQPRPERETQPEIEVEVEPEHPEEPEPAPGPGPSKSRRGQASRKNKRATDTQSTARKEQATRAPPETEVEAEPEPAAPSGSSKSGRTAGSRVNEEAETQATDTEEHPEQANAAPRRSTRKTREPRGETVPVTVHRLANTSVFEVSQVDSGEDASNAGDDLSAQKTKLPNRGGVNPADVLSQICRETLEKTLATLKNGIDNETNQNKRAEWTRKRKAVEAFSTELDGRLLDLSEMLDSNFVLGVQLRKSKRAMMDLRGHLYKVRKERESVALQMDAVRAKHMEEENAKTSRMTINNSFHSLELALDRSQHRAPSDAPPLSADLDFMLHTVADDVSSRAPGGQGGLLNQIRAFNVQLESAARDLERS